MVKDLKKLFIRMIVIGFDVTQFGGKDTIFPAFLFFCLLQNHHTAFQIHNNTPPDSLISGKCLYLCTKTITKI